MGKERNFEQKRVDTVVGKIEKSLLKTQHEYDKARTERSSVEKNYVQNAKINTFEVDDQMETNAEVQQQKQLIAKNVETEKILSRQIHLLSDLEDSPYFGRIDIHEKGETSPETLYIGTSSFNDDMGNFLIYDWRAPISSIYYNGTLGTVSYTTPIGEQEAQLLKKRQFRIQAGKITNMFDTNETVGDELLQEMLGEQSDEYMKNIVATIQKEQNDIIRDTTHDLLIVQGVAGSGKTSAILQRIAFLLYHSRSELSAEQIVLFSPNLLFSHYISEVLPSLGERNMRQVTLAEFFAQRFEGLKVETLFDNFEKKSSSSVNTEITVKEDADFMRTIKEYVTNLDSSHIFFNDLILVDQVIFSSSEIRSLYSKLPVAQPHHIRHFELKNILIKELKKKIKKELNAQWVLKKIDSLTEEEYYSLLGNYQRGRFEDIEAEINYLSNKIVSAKFEPIYEAIYNNYFIDVYHQYSEFLKEVLSDDVVRFNNELEYHRIRLEDCAPILYLRDQITGEGQNHSIQHLFIDEMQDYSLAQIYYLHAAFPNAHLTLLGDSEQALYHEIQAPQELMKDLKQTINPKRARMIELNKSYRSTFEITSFMKALLPDGDKIQAFTRSGSLPKLVLTDESNTISKLLTEARLLLKKNETVAIITKDVATCQVLLKSFKTKDAPTLITNNDRSLPKGLVLLPIYLAKGLEFDAVIAFEVSQNNFADDSSRGVLYTICSRAMHDLVLISVKGISNLITAIPSGLFTIEQDITFKQK
ncbi:RNA polymerase recycling motor HelD [Liquorilactobacillus mali]|uniref:ATP-dependent DNA helicase n=1 Tax=Liquorilactobacillus mali KCTC 3596 = DSM 20444 TaxID=1046596 RepID=J0UUS8_9LACO|nr:RNA polymerase recycling motor HelD [Liquorilactobacillus mali]EJF02045.1 ATP-dependent DNA helicase [Liquorilactobacillus mali KCTC 3596 = DSM 20444]KRN09932.1 ATP-dependent DNA helicase [Liquorilactobacillus mali KCTC 3596 = DSM 20444]MDV7758145.1 AAA family ATPase [Liquorilactobacillus mali]QFQ74066.1 AAA family ATPase [Liquorilactobacillus mali]